MEQNRNRQKTYYNNRKQEILAKKVARKEQDKVFKTPLPPDPMKPHKFTVDMIIVQPNTVRTYYKDTYNITGEIRTKAVLLDVYCYEYDKGRLFQAILEIFHKTLLYLVPTEIEENDGVAVYHKIMDHLISYHLKLSCSSVSFIL